MTSGGIGKKGFGELGGRMSNREVWSARPREAKRSEEGKKRWCGGFVAVHASVLY